eukprot:3980712-Pyramimonas_sp.AAC.1
MLNPAPGQPPHGRDLRGADKDDACGVINHAELLDHQDFSADVAPLRREPASTGDCARLAQ